MLFSDILHEGEYYELSDPSVMYMRIEGVSSDSRDIGQGHVFVSVKGTHTDGESYISESMRRGAVAVVCDKKPKDCGMPYILVENARRALSFMLHRFWGSSGERMKLYAVTGTNGKTSTCFYLREIFMQAGIRTGYIGTLKSYIDRQKLSIGECGDERSSTMTTPDPEQLYRILHKMEAGEAECVIIEASSHALQLDKLAPLRFRCGIFTNFSSEHLDFHRTMDDYLSAKTKLFSMSDKMYLNGDDPVCRALCKGSVPCELFGTGKASDIRAEQIEMHGTHGVSYTAVIGDTKIKVNTSGIGVFSLYNSLAAISAASCAGISADDIQHGIENVTCIDGRLERLKLNGEHKELTVIIDYAHTEGALCQLLSTVSGIRAPGQRIVTLFGCGGDRDKSKRAPMGRCASFYSDLVVITEDNSRSEDTDSIISDIMQGIDKTKEFKIIKNRRKAIEFVMKNARKDDIILLVGKGHEEYEIKNDKKTPFSEKRIVYELLGEGSTEV